MVVPTLNWAQVLYVIYYIEEAAEYPRHGDEHENRLVEETELDVGEVREAIDYMVRHGLAEYQEQDIQRKDDGDEQTWSIILTDKGFDIAHRREIAKRESATGYTIGVFTIVVAFSALLDAFNFVVGLAGIAVIAAIYILIMSQVKFF